MSTETFSPIGMLLKFLDPSYSPLAVTTIGGTAGIFYLHKRMPERWWTIALTIFAVLLWALLTARGALIREINSNKRSKELGLPIALIALVSVVALVVTTDAPGGPWCFLFVLTASIIQLAAVHVLIRLDRQDFFLQNRFHVTQYCWILAALFAAAAYSILGYRSPENWRTDMPEAYFEMVRFARQSLFICIAFAALWAVAVQRIFSLLSISRSTSPMSGSKEGGQGGSL